MALKVTVAEARVLKRESRVVGRVSFMVVGVPCSVEGWFWSENVFGRKI
jgi:hypothetical protein